MVWEVILKKVHLLIVKFCAFGWYHKCLPGNNIHLNRCITFYSFGGSRWCARMLPIQLVVVRWLTRTMGDTVCNRLRMVSIVRPTILYSPTIPQSTMVIVLRLAIVVVVRKRMTSTHIYWGFIFIHIMVPPIFYPPIFLHWIVMLVTTASTLRMGSVRFIINIYIFK